MNWCSCMRSTRWRWPVIALATASCGGNVMTRDPSVSDVSDQATVGVEGDPAGKHACDGTLFVDWAAGTADSIASSSRDGLVVVKSSGCKLEVLGTCHGDKGYDFVAVTPTTDRTEISSEDAIRLGVELKNGKQVGGQASRAKSRSLAYVIVGQDMAAGSPKKLKGDCAGATHYVSAISLGAYGLDSASHTEVTAVVKIHDAKSSDHQSAGDVDRCSKHGSEDDDACRAPLKIDLATIPKSVLQ